MENHYTTAQVEKVLGLATGSVKHAMNSAGIEPILPTWDYGKKPPFVLWPRDQIDALAAKRANSYTIWQVRQIMGGISPQGVRDFLSKFDGFMGRFYDKESIHEAVAKRQRKRRQIEEAKKFLEFVRAHPEATEEDLAQCAEVEAWFAGDKRDYLRKVLLAEMTLNLKWRERHKEANK